MAAATPMQGLTQVFDKLSMLNMLQIHWDEFFGSEDNLPPAPNNPRKFKEISPAILESWVRWHFQPIWKLGPLTLSANLEDGAALTILLAHPTSNTLG